MILLSLDTEEFDLPKESGMDIPLDEAMQIARRGANIFLDILKSEGVKATFFTTATFAQNAPDEMVRIIAEGHEVASHGCDHTHPKREDIKLSKEILSSITGRPVHGYRQPRMFPVDNAYLAEQGYRYNSSLHPAFIPGRYNHFDQPRRPFYKDGILQIPASVSPLMRLPVFWLACHNYPFWLYKNLCRWTWHHDGVFVFYCHPYEFIPLEDLSKWRSTIPFVIRRNNGLNMQKRIRSLIRMFKAEGAEFVTYDEFAQRFAKKTIQTDKTKRLIIWLRN